MGQEDNLFVNTDEHPSAPMIPINIPLIYANAFLVSISLTDLQLTGSVNGRPSFQIVVPFQTAKSLIEVLQTAVKDIEKKTNSKVLTLNETAQLMK